MASAAPKASTFKVSVVFEPRGSNGLRAYSDDVPGFVLSYDNCERTLAAVVPVLETILSDMFNAPVCVKPLEDIRSMLEEAGLISKRPRELEFEMPMPMTREYVTELCA
jgi:hypothetical protein